MPHGLFTRHSRPRFLAIHQDLLEICDGQHCEAALLTEIEFICSVGNISQDQPTARILAGQPSSPYFGISLAGLEARILHLYKVDRIRTGMKWLTDRGFLKISRQPTSQGGVTIWGLEVEAINDALSACAGGRWIPPVRGVDPKPDPLEKPRGTPGKTKGSLKEEEVDSLQTVKKDPPTPQSQIPKSPPSGTTYRLENISASLPIPTLEDAGLNTNKSLKVNMQRIAKYLKFPLNTAEMRRQLPILDRRYRKAHEEGDPEEYLAAILKACSEFHEGEMQGSVLVYCEQQTRDRWRVTQAKYFDSRYNGTQIEQDPKQSCSAFALRLAGILEAAGQGKAEAYRAASSMPDWKMNQIEATAAGIEDFAIKVEELIQVIRGRELSAGGALEMIYRKFGNVQPVKMSTFEQTLASYDNDE